MNKIKVMIASILVLVSVCGFVTTAVAKPLAEKEKHFVKTANQFAKYSVWGKPELIYIICEKARLIMEDRQDGSSKEALRKQIIEEATYSLSASKVKTYELHSAMIQGYWAIIDLAFEIPPCLEEEHKYEITMHFVIRIHNILEENLHK